MSERAHHPKRPVALVKALVVVSLFALLSAANLSAQTAPPSTHLSPAERQKTIARFTPAERQAAEEAFSHRYPLLTKRIADTPPSRGIVRPKSTLQPSQATTMAQPGRISVKTANGGERELWANLTYSDNFESYYERGYYAFTTSNPATLTNLGSTETDNSHYYMNANGGSAIVDGRLHLVYWFSGGGYVWIYKFTFDASTWTQIGSYDEYEDMTLVATETALNTATGTVYGEFYNSEADGFTLGTIDYTNMTRTTFGTSTNTYVALGCTRDDVLYGIATDGYLYRISTTTGEETQVGATGVEVATADGGYYGQSGEIDQQTGTFYWVSKDASGTTALYVVDLATGKATKQGDFSAHETLYGLYVPEAPAEAGAPAAVADLSATFHEGSLTGSVSFTLPSATYGGSTLSGTLSYVLTAGADTIAQGSAEAGTKVTATVTTTEGLVNFGVTTRNAEGQSPAATLKTYVGNDTPKAVEGLNLSIDGTSGEVVLTWNAVSSGINGGYVGNVGYDVVRYPDAKTVATGLTTCSFSETLDATAAQQAYSYGVTPTFAGKRGAESLTGKQVFGAGITPPYEETFATEESLTTFTIIDANDDASTWEYYERGDDHAASYRYSRSNDGDDWLITPALQLKGGTIYNVSFEASSYGYGYTEAVEARFGNSPTAEAMTQTIVEKTEITSSDYTTFTGEIVVPSDQKTYIGLHAVSPADQYRLFVRNLRVTEGLSTAVPDSATQFRLKADATGALVVEGQFVTPTKTVACDDLGTRLSRVCVVRNQNDTIATFDAPATGTQLTFTDTPSENGLFTYSVIAFTAEGAGRVQKGSVYVGIDAPLAPKNVRLTDQKESIRMTWQAVGNQGQNGGVVRPDDVVYEVYGVVLVSDASDVPLAGSVKGETAFNFDYPTTTGDQTLVQCGVAATTEGGQSAIAGSTPLVVGQAYTLPFSESLAGGSVSYLLWGEQTGRSTFAISTDLSADNDGGSLVLKTAAPEETAWINTGKISLAGAKNPMVRFFHYADPRSDMQLRVEVQKPDGSIDSIYTFDYATLDETSDDTWRTASVSLSDYVSADYVMIRFCGQIGGKAYSLYIDNISVCDVEAVDLATTVTAPSSMRKGTSAKVSACITNNGSEAVSPFSVRLLADEKEVATATITDALQPMTSTTVDFNYKSTVFAAADEVELKVVAEANGETATHDNYAIAYVALTSPTQPGPKSITASRSDNGAVALAWQSPDNEGGLTTDDMEGYTSWATDNFGAWTSVYGPGRYPSGGIYSSNRYEHEGETFGFIVFDPNDWSTELTASNPSLAPHSGSKYLASFYNYTGSGTSTKYGDCDDWLISPTLSGEAQTVTFYVNNINTGSTDYPETFRLLYSTTGTDTTQFVRLGNEYTVSGGTWQQVSASLPEGATHFAIHHTTAGLDAFVFLVDDVTYIAGTSQVIGYNVYRDEQLLGEVASDVLNYSDPTATTSAHVYGVTALYAEGESLPALAPLTSTGIESVEASPNQSADVFTPTGVRVGRTADDLHDLPHGVYITGGRKIVKK